jgi:cytosolic carboxypeptidase protein 5
MNGILKELVEQTAAMQALLNRFVFYLVPVVNPDGVARGHYRLDSKGVNLNRCYISPKPKEHGAVYAVK